jgi:hypothetical protein
VNATPHEHLGLAQLPLHLRTVDAFHYTSADKRTNNNQKLGTIWSIYSF